MSSIFNKLVHAIKIATYKLLSITSLLPSDNFDFSSCAKSSLKIFTYHLPKKYSSNSNYDLRIVYKTYQAIDCYFRNYVATDNPSDADYFFVPINLHKYQLANKNPEEVLKYLKYLTNKKDHIIIATGDFSNRSNSNKYGKAYRDSFPWLKNFILLALESSTDLIKNQDIGIIPFNVLSDRPLFNNNIRPYLYSFLGETKHVFLPIEHIRSMVGSMKSSKDVYIGSKLDKMTKDYLRINYSTQNDYELMSRNSIFTLAPAGYGRWSYRFFQAITWGSIPVLLSDGYVKPFSDLIPYDDFSLTIQESDINKIDEIIRSIPNKQIFKMQESLKKSQKYFTKNSFINYLSSTLTDRLESSL